MDFRLHILIFLIGFSIVFGESKDCPQVCILGASTAYTKRLQGIYNRTEPKCNGRYVYTKRDPTTYAEYHLQFVEKKNKTDFQGWVVTITRCASNSYNLFRSQDGSLYPHSSLVHWEEFNETHWVKNNNLKVKCSDGDDCQNGDDDEDNNPHVSTSRSDDMYTTKTNTRTPTLIEEDLLTGADIDTTNPTTESTSDSTTASTGGFFSRSSKSTDKVLTPTRTTTKRTPQRTSQSRKKKSTQPSTKKAGIGEHAVTPGEETTSESKENNSDLVRFWLPLAICGLVIVILIFVLILVCKSKRRSLKQGRGINSHRRQSISNTYEVCGPKHGTNNNNASATGGHCTGGHVLSSPTIHLNISLPNLLDALRADDTESGVMMLQGAQNVTVKCVAGTLKQPSPKENLMIEYNGNKPSSLSQDGAKGTNLQERSLNNSDTERPLPPTKDYQRDQIPRQISKSSEVLAAGDQDICYGGYASQMAAMAMEIKNKKKKQPSGPPVMPKPKLGGPKGTLATPPKSYEMATYDDVPAETEGKVENGQFIRLNSPAAIQKTKFMSHNLAGQVDTSKKCNTLRRELNGMPNPGMKSSDDVTRGPDEKQSRFKRRRGRKNKGKASKTQEEPLYEAIDDSTIPYAVVKRRNTRQNDDIELMVENENYEGLPSYYFSSDDEFD